MHTTHIDPYTKKDRKGKKRNMGSKGNLAPGMVTFLTNSAKTVGTKFVGQKVCCELAEGSL